MNAFVDSRNEQPKITKDPIEEVKLLGEIGVLLRILGKLDDAEKYLIQAGIKFLFGNTSWESNL